MEAGGATLHETEWGGMNVELGAFKERFDITPLLKGLPGNQDQCPHWGYVFKGRIRFKFGSREEIISAGDAYYAPPGHTTIVEAGTEYVEFSPADLLKKTMEVVERNMAALKK
ncbi:MAG: cupin domain-containing protein [Chloroflexi bacterium]|nr:cupin domain-containing protein [Chloroflexota bacterium]